MTSELAVFEAAIR